MIRRNRQTKIVATLGPASSTREVIERLFRAGVDVFRLNFSHGSHADHRARLSTVRALEAETGRPVGVIADMQGPKLRIGKFADGKIPVKPGHVIRLDLDPAPGDPARVNLPHPEIIEALSPGDDILIDDGKVRMRIQDKGPDFMVGEIVTGAVLSDRKGFNVPGVILPIAALTEKDRVDLEAAISMGVDWIAQSFVQRPEDVAEAKALIAGRAALMIKVEKPSALDHIDAMVDLADGVMLARGDLGVEIPAEDVPSVQKQIVRKVRFAGKPIIVATQMLESMIDNARPTRAEASDVATAVYDGADAVMLSAETASGSWPVEAVEIMDRIARRTEADETYRRIIDSDPPPGREGSASDAITAAAHQVANAIDAACITNYTSSGSTTLRTARQRPDMPILCLTEHVAVARRLVLSYGVHPVQVEGATDFASAVRKAIAQARIQKMAEPGQRIVITAGVPFGTSGSTNILRVATVEE
jgi:pyruvate kinase